MWGCEDNEECSRLFSVIIYAQYIACVLTEVSKKDELNLPNFTPGVILERGKLYRRVCSSYGAMLSKGKLHRNAPLFQEKELRRKMIRSLNVREVKSSMLEFMDEKT